MAKVLILENDPAVAQLLTLVLSRRGHAVEVLAGGEEALGRLALGGVDLLVSDLFLSGIGGLEVLDRAAAAGTGTPALVISGYLDAAAQGRLERNPLVRGWLKKPFDILELAELVERNVS